jgi:hypothetical protein
MTARSPRDPRETRQKSLVLFLRVALGLALLTSALAVLLPEPRARELGVMTVALLIAVPLIRVVWLAVRWALKRDYRFAATAALLATIVVAAELAGAL